MPTDSDLFLHLGRIEGKLDAQGTKIDDIQSQVRLTNGRVTLLERDRVVYMILGKAMWLIFGAGLSSVVLLIKSLV